MHTVPACFGIIPARFESSRFPGKPLADINGFPMFWHVYERARKCPELHRVVLATDDDRIHKAARHHNVPVVMTATDHASGSDRVLEAAHKLKLPSEAVVVNIQGDEPLLEPAMLSQLIEPFQRQPIRVATLAREINAGDAQNPDIVKVVFSATGRALYFSRHPIPYPRGDEPVYFGHIGLYAFKLQALEEFVNLPPSRLEKTEKLEQLRLMGHDIDIRVILTEYETIGVDRPEDIDKVCRLINTTTADP